MVTENLFPFKKCSKNRVMKLLTKVLFTGLLLFHCLFSFSQTSLKLVEFATGYTRPLDIKHAGDKRLFIVSQPGIIYIIDSAGTKIATPFLDINNKVVDSGNERGLLGLAFHPNYKQNGYFYVNYIGNDGNSRISRFSVTADPNVASSASEVILLSITQPFQNHNGGCLQFGPDGYLYIASGDGGSGGDPQANAQNPLKMLGKILRIDVDNGVPYAIPADNPFANNTDTLPEIWSLGMRNPWRFSFDRLTGDKWIGDVGQDTWEEIDFEAAGSKGGLNFGWRCYEANANYNLTNCGPKDSYVFPVFAYDQSTNDCSVTGGYVYRGTKYPGLYGKYVYADYCSGKIHVLYKNKQNTYTDLVLADLTNLDYSSFGEDIDGELYISGLSTGKIFKFTLDCPTNATQYEITRPCQDTAGGSIGLLLNGNFSISWSNGDTTTSINNLTPGKYSVTIVNNNNFCAETINDIEIKKWEQPDLSITWSDSLLSLNSGILADSIQWYLNGAPLPGANNPFFKPLKSGNYYAVFVSTESGCQYTTEVKLIVVTSTSLLLKKIVDFLWPNPTNEVLNLQFESKLEQFDYNIYNSLGSKLNTGKQNESAQINTNYLSPGLYFLEIITADGRQVLNFVKK